jgi:hypothetical protein
MQLKAIVLAGRVFPTSKILLSNNEIYPQTWGQPVDMGIKDIERAKQSFVL